MRISDWSSDVCSSDLSTIASIDATTGIATASYTPNATGATITATLNTDPDQQATATMIVTAEVCTIPLTTDEGATAIEGPDVGVCLLCNVSHPERVVDPANTPAGVINVGGIGSATCRDRACQYV